jgi:serine/threonine protein kinase
VHGGLSPDSILVTGKGHATIPAFELAARGGFETGDGGVRLRDYDSPEEARGERPDERSDTYSVGAILYEMLAARRPHHRGAAAPSASNPHVPKELDDLVLRAVAPNPDSRCQTAATLSAELRSVLAILDVRGVPGDDEEIKPERSTSVWRVAVTTAVILVVAVAIVWWLTRP